MTKKNRRYYLRKRVKTPIVFRIPVVSLQGTKQKDEFKTYQSENLSLGGAFLKTGAPISAGIQIEVHFSLPNSPKIIKTKAKIIWTAECKGGSKDVNLGMGIQFINMTKEFQDIILEYLKDLPAED